MASGGERVSRVAIDANRRVIADRFANRAHPFDVFLMIFLTDFYLEGLKAVLLELTSARRNGFRPKIHA